MASDHYESWYCIYFYSTQREYEWRTGYVPFRNRENYWQISVVFRDRYWFGTWRGVGEPNKGKCAVLTDLLYCKSKGSKPSCKYLPSGYDQCWRFGWRRELVRVCRFGCILRHSSNHELWYELGGFSTGTGISEKLAWRHLQLCCQCNEPGQNHDGTSWIWMEMADIRYYGESWHDL